MIEVIGPGPLTTVQDMGRPGYAALGVGRSGAADPASLALANRLVGNAETCACLETTLGGLTVLFTEPATVAVTGARTAVWVGERQVGMDGPEAIPGGAILRIERPARGLRSYLAVRGGIAVEPVLGSRSTDLLSGLGPAPLRAGDTLPIGPLPRRFPDVDQSPVPAIADEPVLRLTPGPRRDWFSRQSRDGLVREAYLVTPTSNRIGLRLLGPRLRRLTDAELPSEGMVTGALQVPPDGQPMLLLADHPVTGGYPVIAIVRDADISLAAQASPGQRVRFRWDSGQLTSR
jgi:biotin-dependent carboxylase-like uncharacterized protein